jgi:hypothetical protein
MASPDVELQSMRFGTQNKANAATVPAVADNY